MAFGYVVLCVLVLVVILLITYVSFLMSRIVTLSQSNSQLEAIFAKNKIANEQAHATNEALIARNEHLHILNDGFANVNAEQQTTIENCKKANIALKTVQSSFVFLAHNTNVANTVQIQQLREKIKELNEKIKQLEQNEQLKEQNCEDVGSKRRKT